MVWIINQLKFAAQPQSVIKKRSSIRRCSNSNHSNRKRSKKKTKGSVRVTKVEPKQKKAKIKKVNTLTGSPPALILSQCRPPNPFSNENSVLTNPVPAVAPAISIPQPIPSTNHNELSTLSHIYDFPTLSSVPLHTLSNSSSLSHPYVALTTLPLSDLDSFSLSNVVSDNPFSTLNTCPRTLLPIFSMEQPFSLLNQISFSVIHYHFLNQFS